VGSSVYNRARALLGAGGASGRAGTEGGPGGHLAVNGAAEGVASYGHAQSRADSTTVHGGVDSGAGLGLLAGTTSGRAGRIASPGRHLAVDGTGESVAGLHTIHGWTRYAPVAFPWGDNGASALLGTRGASGRASSEGIPVGPYAVHAAIEGVAVLHNREGFGGSNAAIHGRGNNRARLGLGTSATSLGAGRVAGPSRKLAVNGARLGVANTIFGRRTGVTAVLGSNVNAVSARLLARAASLRASGPSVPGMLAVNGARVGVAVLLSRGDAANHTAMSGCGNNRLGTTVDAATAKLGTG